MRRSEFVEIVREVAVRAHLSDDDLKTLTFAVSNPSVKRVGFSTYGDGSDNRPYCPLRLAWGFESTRRPSRLAFADRYDRRMWQLTKLSRWHRFRLKLHDNYIELSD